MILGFSEGNSCGAWTSEHRIHSVKTAQLEAWVLGFLSGWAETLASAPEGMVVSRDPLAGTNATAAIEWVSRYCAQHALDTLTEAARLSGEELIRRQKPNSN
jgi:hypothetical protein